MRVIGNRVLVAPYEKKSITAGGLILPEQAQEESNLGIVLALGDGEYNKRGVLCPIDNIDPGDVVLYSKYGGTEIEVEGEAMLLVAPKDILAVMGEDG